MTESRETLSDTIGGKSSMQCSALFPARPVGPKPELKTRPEAVIRKDARRKSVKSGTRELIELLPQP